ncbi:unnamed protein product [Dicrocoelium dendriticum]|nr:unnamed protein product [Dicrocoelium dendriticum]
MFDFTPDKPLGTNRSCVGDQQRECPSIESALIAASKANLKQDHWLKQFPFLSDLIARCRTRPFAALLLSGLLCCTFATIQMMISVRLIEVGKLSALLPHHIIMALMTYAVTVLGLVAFLGPAREMNLRSILLITTTVMHFLLCFFTLLDNVRQLMWEKNQPLKAAPWVQSAIREAKSTEPRILVVLLVLNLVAVVIPMQNLFVLFMVYEKPEAKLSEYSETSQGEMEDECASVTD